MSTGVLHPTISLLICTDATAKTQGLSVWRLIEFQCMLCVHKAWSFKTCSFKSLFCGFANVNSYIRKIIMSRMCFLSGFSYGGTWNPSETVYLLELHVISWQINMHLLIRVFNYFMFISTTFTQEQWSKCDEEWCCFVYERGLACCFERVFCLFSYQVFYSCYLNYFI